MPELDDLEFLDDDESGEDDEKDEKDDGVFGTGLTLEELAARPGDAGALSRELLAIREERKAKAAAEEAAKAAAEALEAGTFDWDNPAALDALRGEVLARRAAADAGAEELIRQAAIAEGLGEESVAMKVANYRKLSADSAWLVSSDPLTDHPAVIERAAQELARQREAQALSGFRTLNDDAADAQKYIDEAIAAARARS